MAITVNTNVLSLNAQRNLDINQASYAKSLERLSSGLRINRAADDSAGLAISERLKAQIRSTGQASRNTLDGVSLIQTAEGSFNETSSILVRLRELAVQSANGTLGTTDRDAIKTESDQLVQEISRLANVTKFNGVALLSGNSVSAAVSFSFQVGTGTTTNDTISVSIQNVKASIFGSGAVDLTALSLTSASNAIDALTTIDSAITNTNTSRAALGAAQNRLDSAGRSLDVIEENLSAANSRIRDVDVASETANLTRSNILQQAGASVLAQANQAPQLALSLLGR